MKHILISVGPIPGKLDSVKIITNKFKGGLAAMTAKELAKKRPSDKITVVKWNDTPFYKPEEPELKNIEIVNVDDFFAYEKFILNNKFDAYILAAAVANLIPKTPWEGKFPSHNYKEGDEINIPFIIANRVIAHVKEKFPRSTLIGYKLFDGTEEELIKAGWGLLVETKANAVFCNNPKTAKEKKICLMPDGAKIELGFEEHINFINRIIDLKWYKTEIIADSKPKFEKQEEFIKILDKTAEKFPPYMFGCFACRAGEGFYTTTRGKKEIKNNFAYVYRVDHKNKIVFADKKASLNAPLLDMIFSITQSKIIVHAHKKIDVEQLDYVFSGTNEEDELENNIKRLHKEGKNAFAIKFHGYYAWFNNIEEAEAFTESREIKDIDWNNYSREFPERYIKQSKFDSEVIEEIANLAKKVKRKLNVLEIGANNDARFMSNEIENYYVFDKFTNNAKNSIPLKESDLGSVNVDLIIMRGTFNYLTKEEISRLKEIISRNSCVLMFNTFSKPSSIRRPYKSLDSEGIETSEYDEKTNKIVHTLYPNNKPHAIRHSFFYYDLEQIRTLFNGLKCEEKQDNNSIQIKIS